MAGWPTANDYSLAVAKRAFVHPRLAGLTFRRMKRINRPVLFTGNYAATFALEDPNGRPKALKLFTRHVPDRADRYAAIAGFLTERTPPQFVGFEYLPQAVQIEGVRYPGLLMDWANGVPLDTYVSANLEAPEALRRIAADILAFAASTEQQGFAHGDLQHDNILVADRLRLIDYDGMFVPAMAGRPAVESGHQNYQHPGRRRQAFGPRIDRFSAIAIYLALQAAIMAPRLYAEHAVENGLLFRKGDFEDPRHSAVIAALDRLRPLRPAARAFAALCAGDVEAVPSLADFAGQTGLGPRQAARAGSRPATAGGWSLFGRSSRSATASSGAPAVPPVAASGAGAGRGLGPWRPAAWSAAIVVAYLAGAHLLRDDAAGPAAPTIAAPAVEAPAVTAPTVATPAVTPPSVGAPPVAAPVQPQPPAELPSVAVSPARPPSSPVEPAMPPAASPPPPETVVATPVPPVPVAADTLPAATVPGSGAAEETVAAPVVAPSAIVAPPPAPQAAPVRPEPPAAVTPAPVPPAVTPSAITPSAPVVTPHVAPTAEPPAAPPPPIAPPPDAARAAVQLPAPPAPPPASSAPAVSAPTIGAKPSDRPACAGRELVAPGVTPQSEPPAGEGPATRAELRCLTPETAADDTAHDTHEPPVATTGRARATRPAHASGAPTRPRPRPPAFRPPEPRKPVFETPLH